MGATAAGALADPRSMQGTMTFDGGGAYTFTGQQVTGTAAAAGSSGSGTYSVDPAGFVIMTSPIRTGDQVNARLSAEALIGSGTETTDNTFDLPGCDSRPDNSRGIVWPLFGGHARVPQWILSSNVINTIFST